MLLRAAKPLDALGVARVHVRSWRAAYRGLLPDDYLDALTPKNRARGYSFGARGLADPATILALEHEEICGFVTTGPSQDPQNPNAGEVMALYVDPEHWGSGIGRTLIGAARERLHAIGFTAAILWVLDGNENAERFYAADGWTPDGSRRIDRPWGQVVHELRYRRPLP
jgi:GNAT superfamily N-acetyltransferase